MSVSVIVDLVDRRQSPTKYTSEPHWTYERKGVNKVIAYGIDPQKPGQPDAERAALVFERSGSVD